MKTAGWPSMWTVFMNWKQSILQGWARIACNSVPSNSCFPGATHVIVTPGAKIMLSNAIPS